MTIRRAIPTCRFGERSVALGAEIRPDRPAQAGRQRFAPDSPVEGDGFEPSVPRKEPHANAFKRRMFSTRVRRRA